MSMLEFGAEKSWKDIVRAALFDPVLRAAVTFHNQSSASKEQVLICAALALVEINKKQKEQLVDAMRKGCASLQAEMERVTQERDALQTVADDMWKKYATAESTLAALQAAQQWRPMETAPKDETILIWAESPATGERRTYRAWWAIPYEGSPESNGWWETAYPRGHSPVVRQFVHGWLPLPAPPTEEGK